MHIETSGLVIKEQAVGESDRLITVLTAEYGLIRAFVRRAKNVKSNLVSSTQLLSYSDFVFYKTKNSYTVDSAHAKNVFFGLREDIDALSISFYLAELFGELAPENAEASELLSLLLNSLYLMSEKKRDVKLVKAVAELRGLSDAGYMPNLVACQNCGEYETDMMYFNPSSGTLTCQNCGDPSSGLLMSLSAITAMRYIVFSEKQKIFNFSLEKAPMEELSEAVERFALAQTGRHFKTLDFYKSLAI